MLFSFVMTCMFIILISRYIDQNMQVIIDNMCTHQKNVILHDVQIIRDFNFTRDLCIEIEHKYYDVRCTLRKEKDTEIIIGSFAPYIVIFADKMMNVNSDIYVSISDHFEQNCYSRYISTKHIAIDNDQLSIMCGFNIDSIILTNSHMPIYILSSAITILWILIVPIFRWQFRNNDNKKIIKTDESRISQTGYLYTAMQQTVKTINTIVDVTHVDDKMASTEVVAKRI